jgi:hypothetical protein
MRLPAIMPEPRLPQGLFGDDLSILPKIYGGAVPRIPRFAAGRRDRGIPRLLLDSRLFRAASYATDLKYH